MFATGVARRALSHFIFFPPDDPPVHHSGLQTPESTWVLPQIHLTSSVLDTRPMSQLTSQGPSVPESSHVRHDFGPLTERQSIIPHNPIIAWGGPA
jgi:hypothetical protein